MSSKAKEIKIETFCKTFDDFLEDLQTLKPNDNSLKLLKKTIKTLYLIKPELVVIQFMNYTSSYSSKILEKDETFFLNDLQDDIVEGYEWVKDEIKKIKEIWPNATISTKENIWKYFQIFIKLGNSILKDIQKEQIISC